MVRSLGLTGVRVVAGRVEAMAGDPREAGAYDLALARAVAPPQEQGRLVQPFLRSGGLFLVQLGPGPMAPNALERLLAMGFELSRELSVPPAIGRPGRRVLALRRAGPGAGRDRFT